MASQDHNEDENMPMMVDTAENQDSTQRDEAQQRSSPSVMVAKKIKSTQAETYEIKTDEQGNEWFCAEGKEQSKFYRTLGIDSDSALSCTYIF